MHIQGLNNLNNNSFTMNDTKYAMRAAEAPQHNTVRVSPINTTSVPKFGINCSGNSITLHNISQRENSNHNLS